MFKEPSLSVTVKPEAKEIVYTSRFMQGKVVFLEGMLNETNKSVLECSHVTSSPFPGQHRASYVSLQED